MGFNIRELMSENVQGFTTDKDYVAIQYQKSKIKAIVEAMSSEETDESLRIAYGFRDNRDWSLEDARKALKKLTDKDSYVTEVCYRPFDTRWTYFHKAMVTYPRPLLQTSVFNRMNYVLCLGKEGNTIGDKEWSLAYISTLPTDKNVIPRGGVYLFKMAALGKEMRHLHLLESITEKDFESSYSIWIPKDNNLCTCRKFEETGRGYGRVWINDEQFFDHVPTKAWNMVVAGYQPLDRWLKDRKDKVLTSEEIEHYRKMIVALQRQAEVMKEIDETIQIQMVYNKEN